ncbi:MAG: hypothetical protein RMJ97_09170 [Raineya sp.]|nr:hypothetical protein [Raineya sp.]MDW8297036.1 hypothetical protein [Raineya sp.]
MKKNAFVLLFLVLANFAVAQTTWQWKQHNLKFSLPNGFKVKNNTANHFQAKGVGVEFDIFVWQDRKVTAKNMKDALIVLADTYIDHISQYGEHDLDDFEGAYVIGDYQGKKTIFFGFIDKRGGTNFFAEVIFDEDDEDALQDAFHIVDSIDRID